MSVAGLQRAQNEIGSRWKHSAHGLLVASAGLKSISLVMACFVIVVKIRKVFT